MEDNRTFSTQEFTTQNNVLSTFAIDRTTEMAWEDRTTFEDIDSNIPNNPNHLPTDSIDGVKTAS